MSDRDLGYWEALYLFHRRYAQRHSAKAEEARVHLETFHPQSSLVGGVREGDDGPQR